MMPNKTIKLSKLQLETIIRESHDKIMKEMAGEDMEPANNAPLPGQPSQPTTLSFGVTPSVEELDVAMKGKPFNIKWGAMGANSADAMAWNYSMKLAGLDPNKTTINTAEEMHEIVSALYDALGVDMLSEDQFFQVQDIIETWEERFGGRKDIQEHAHSTASAIIEHLGWEVM